MQKLSGDSSEFEAKAEPLATLGSVGRESSILSKDTLALIERMGFELLSSYQIADLKTDVITLKHKSSQAVFVSIHNDDPLGRFHARVTTIPEDSTGVFHKLEHALLSGSKSVRVAEPFEEMRRSLIVSDTNASTSDDHTEYYCVSKDPASLNIMRGIMLDAMLRGTLTEDVFKREHGYLQFVPNEDGSADLVFSGIVHGEMSGYYASPGMWIGNAQRKALMPNTPYVHDSGGNPAEMPALSYEKFLEAYKKHYGTSNFTVAIYGDEPLESRLKFISEQFKDTWGVGQRIELLTPQLSGIEREELVSYPAETADPKVLESREIFDLTWKIPRVENYQEDLELVLLTMMLGTSQSSPLQQAAYQSGMGNSYSGMGYSPIGKEDLLSFQFVNCRREECKPSAEVVLKSLQKLVQEGFPPQLIEAAINSYEYSARREVASPERGKSICSSILEDTWHGSLEGDELSVEQRLSRVREKLAAGELVFEKLVEKYILTNPNRIDIICVPDPDLMASWMERQIEWVNEQAEALGDEGLDLVDSESRRLKSLEDLRGSDKARESFPVAEVPDSFRQHPRVPVVEDHLADVKVYRAFQPTNGIVSVGVEISLAELSKEQLQLVLLMAGVMTKCGPKGSEAGSYSAKVGALSGGISAHIDLRGEKRATPDPTLWPEVFLRLQGEAKPDHYASMMELLKAPLIQPDFNQPEFLRNLVEQSITNLELGRFDPQALIPELRTRLSETSSATGWLCSLGSIDEQLCFLNSLQERMAYDWQGVVSEMESLWKSVFRKDNVSSDVILDQEHFGRFSPILEQHLEELSSHLVSAREVNPPKAFVVKNRALGFRLPTESNYVGAQIVLKEENGLHTSNQGKVEVVCALMDRYLNAEVRSKGGAYGATASFDQRSGALQFLSWQDPHIERTINVYKGVSDYLRNQVSEDLLKRAKVMTANAVDRDMSASERGLMAITYYRSKHSAEDLDLYRAQIADLTLDDVRIVADQIERAFNVPHTVVVYGSEEALDQAKRLGVIKEISS